MASRQLINLANAEPIHDVRSVKPHARSVQELVEATLVLFSTEPKEKCADRHRLVLWQTPDRQSVDFHTETASPAIARRSSDTAKLRRLETGHRAGTGCEALLLEPGALQHGEEEIRQRVVVRAIEGQVLTVAEAASGEQHRHVAIIVA